MDLDFSQQNLLEPDQLRYNHEKDELSIGIRIPKESHMDDPLEFLKDSNRLNQSSFSIKDEMDMCYRLYRNEDIIGTAIDAMIAFASTELIIEPTKYSKLNKIFKYFQDNVNQSINITYKGLSAFEEQFFMGLFIHGNVFPYENWEMTKYDNMNFVVPSQLLILNPQKMYIDSDALQWGIEDISIVMDDALTKIISRDGRSNPEIIPLKRMFTRNQLKKMKKNKGNWGEYKIRLNPNFVFHVKRKAMPYQAWGIPFLTRAFDAISQLHQIREMDRAVIDGIIKALVVIKLGSDKFPASQTRLNAFARLLNKAKPVEYLVWPHDVDSDVIQPDSDILNYEDKYKESYDRVFYALGVPPMLLGREYRGDAKISITTFSEMLKGYQKYFIEYVKLVLQKIAHNNGFKNIQPEARMNPININKLELWTAMRDAFLTGIISRKQYLETLGFNWEETIELKKKENTDEMKDLFSVPQAPFQGNPEENEEDKKGKVQKPGDKGGRPPVGEPDNENEKMTQKKKRLKTAASWSDLYDIYKDRIDSALRGISSSDEEDDVRLATIDLERELKSIAAIEKISNMDELWPKIDYVKQFIGSYKPERVVETILELMGVKQDA